MIIAVTGPRGRLGSELVERGCVPITANVLDYAALYQELSRIRPDVVIHCAAYTDVDACENAPTRAATINTGGVYTLMQAFQGKLIYISTDYIFDGKAGPYREDDKPNPLSIYGWSKLGGEILARQRPDSLIIRTTVLFDHYSSNFVSAIIKKLSNGESVSVPDSLYGSPTYVPHLAEAILSAIDLTGVINIAGSRVISRLKFARMIAKELGQGVSCIFDGPVTGSAPRPRHAGLNVSKAQVLGLPIYDPLEGVKEIVNVVAAVAAG